MIRNYPTWALTVVYAAVPALALVIVATSAVWGANGLLEWQRLESVRVDASVDLATLERHNQRLLREMRLMDSDPVVLERLVAEELGWGREGTTLVRFDYETEAH
jgi:cell division protein FtsB